MCLSQLKRAPPDIWFCTNGGELAIKLPRLRGYWHHEVDCLLPGHCNQQESWSLWLSSWNTLSPLYLLHHSSFLLVTCKDKAIICISGALAKGETYLIFVCLFVWFIFYLFFLICSGFCHTLKWNGPEFTCLPHPDPPSHLPLHPLPPGLPRAPGPSACLMHPTWAGDLFHPW